MEEHQVAKRLREYRQVRGLSLERLAHLSGLTKGYISRIERSPKPPPLFTLSKISAALGVDVATLLADGPPATPVEITVSRNKEHPVTDGRGTPYKYVYEALAPGKPGKYFEPYIVTVSSRKATHFSHEGQEFLYVLEGKMEFSYKEQTYALGQGDSAFFDAAAPHGGRSLGDAPARILIVIYSYKRV